MCKKGNGKISYGIILFKNAYSEMDKQVLIVRKKYSYSYKNVIKMEMNIDCGQLTLRERENIICKSFHNDLPKILGTNKFNRKTYFDDFNKYYNSYLYNCIFSVKSVENDPPWGFPRGRKNNYLENDLDCALREFTEESLLSEKDFNVIHEDFIIHKIVDSDTEFEFKYYIAILNDNNICVNLSYDSGKTFKYELDGLKFESIYSTIFDENAFLKNRELLSKACDILKKYTNNVYINNTDNDK